MDQVVPWKLFDEKLKELQKNPNEYEKETTDLINIIKTFVTDALDAYSLSIKSIYDWSAAATPILSTSIELFEKNIDDDAKEQQKLPLINVLGDGLNVVLKAQRKLGSCTTNLNKAAGKLESLSTQLGLELSVNSPYYRRKMAEFAAAMIANGAVPSMFAAQMMSRAVKTFEASLQAEMEFTKQSFETLRGQLTKASADINDKKSKLHTLMWPIEILNKAIEILHVNLQDSDLSVIIKSVQSLLNNCNEFHQKYIH